MKLSINFDAFKPLLKDLFSSPESFLKEACQNSQRAGATRIDLSYDSATRILLIEDNGKGFDDKSWAAFFDICTSGWNQEVTTEQKPFGIGALSLLVPSEEVIVWSHNVMESYSDKLLTDNEFESDRTITNDAYEGTMIGLKIKEDFKIERVLSSIKVLFNGFTIPVFFNEVEIPRFNAMDALVFDKADFGSIFISRPDLLHKGFILDVYLQGYLIKSLSSSSRNEYSRAVVHLQSNLFQSRVPDRTELVSGKEECLDSINSYIEGVIAEFIAKEHSTLDLDDFSHKYFMAAKKYLPSVAKTLPIPEYLIKQPVSVYYTNEHETGDIYNPISVVGKKAFSEEDISNLGVVFEELAGCLDSYEDSGCDIDTWEGKEWLAHHWMLANNSYFVEANSIPSDHWVHSHLVSVGDIAGVEVVANGDSVNHSVKVSNYENVKTTLCDSYVLTLKLSDDTALSTQCDDEAVFIQGTLYLPKKSSKFYGDIIRSIFICHNGSEWGFELDESHHDSLLNTFDFNLSLLSNDLNSAIKEILISHKSTLEQLKERFGNHKVSFSLNDLLEVEAVSAA